MFSPQSLFRVLTSPYYFINITLVSFLTFLPDLLEKEKKSHQLLRGLAMVSICACQDCLREQTLEDRKRISAGTPIFSIISF